MLLLTVASTVISLLGDCTPVTGSSWIVEGSVQIPVSQDLNGSALENDYIVRAGFRWNF